MIRNLGFRSLLAMPAALALAACAAGGTAAPPAGGLQDDFSSGACRFGSIEGTSTLGYECVDGEFRAWIDNDQEPYDFITSSTGETYGDVRIEVDASFASGEDAGAYIICRGSQVSGSFYYFRVGVDGVVEITDYLEGEEQIARLNNLPAGALQPGWNRLRADCLGNDLALYVNGELVLEREIEGGAYGPGDIGLGAGGGSLGLSEVRFDNLLVDQP
jgi:hypothetical protein